MKYQIEKAEVLNNLLKINRDRMEYYESASENTEKLNLKIIFSRIAVESKRNASALIHEMTKAGNRAMASHTTKKGNFYLFKMKLKAIFNAKDTQSVLDSCVSGEDKAQTAYLDAISSSELTMQARQMVRNQQAVLKSFYDMMMTVRNSTPVLAN